MTTDDANNTTPPLPTPLVRLSRGISVIWTLPLLALILCGWLLIQSIQDAGIEITILFDDASGIVANKTQVVVNGIPVGLVEELEPDIEQNQVRVKVIMDKELEPHLVADTLFWVVRPELSAARVIGLETIFTGSYIGVQIGTATKAQRIFRGLDSAPPISSDAPGLHIQLRAQALGSIQTGTGVYFKNIEVGTVQGYQLEPDGTILIDLHIKPKYNAVVRKGSRFCNASGLTISGKLTNLKVQFESLASLLKGGILLHTPAQEQGSPPAQNGQVFPLYKDYDDANYGIPMTLQLASGVDIVEGVTKVMYRGIEAGFVKEIQINNDAQRTVTAHILLDPRAELILRQNTVFWIVKPEITPAGVRNLRSLVTGPHITFQPGDGKYTNHFQLLPEPPPEVPLRPGTTFRLQSTNGINLSAGAPIYCKNIKVGEVVSVDLSTVDATVITTIFLYSPYQEMVRMNSVFWLQAGLEVSADLSGLTVETGPLARLLHGGINLVTPEDADPSAPSPPAGHLFFLYPNYNEAVAATPPLQPPGVRFQLRTNTPGNLHVGAPILHRNIEIGRINGFSFSPDRQDVLIDCFIAQQYADLLTKSTRFYQVSGVELSGGLNGFQLQVAPLESVLRGGIACILRPQSPPLVPHEPLPLYDSLNGALHGDDTVITARFTELNNLNVGSAIRYKGVNVGEVTDISFTDDRQQVHVRFRVDDAVAPLFRTSTRIWQVRPELSLHSIRNAETAIFGSYITFLPGAGKPTRDFIALKEPPQPSFNAKEGLPIILETSRLGSLTVGSPLSYRQLQIGEVTGFELSPSFQKVYVFVLIAPKFAPIIRQHSRFWNVSGAQVEGGLLSGIRVDTESLEAVIRGGIAMATPDNAQAGGQAPAGHHFTLYDTAEKDWLDWSPDMVLLELAEQQPKKNNDLQR